MKRLLFFILLLLSAPAFAQTSSIYLQNNTKLDLKIRATQYGPNIMNPGNWSLKDTTMRGWEMSKQLLETNRINGISNGQTFYFDVEVSYLTDTIKLRLKVEGTFIGSTMKHSLSGAGFNHSWYGDENFHQQNLIFGNLPVTIKYKADGTDLLFSRNITFAIQDNNTRYRIDSVDFFNPNVINVLSYNIKFLPPPIGTFDAPQRANVIPTYISQYQDVVIFQEAFEDAARINNLIPAMTTAGFPYHSNVVNDNVPLAENGGVIIFSRWPILFEDEYDYRNCDNNAGDCFAAKGVLYTKINKLGKNYHVFGTHMEAGGGVNDNNIKMEQFGEQRDFIASQNIPVNEAVILGGDMNTSASSVQYAATVDSLNPIIGLHKGYHASTNVFSTPGNIIDHIWGHRAHLVPTDCYTKVWILRGIDDEIWDIFNPSDHLPVNGRFEYPDADTPAVLQTEICGSSPLVLNAPYNSKQFYQWYLNGNPIAGATTAIYTNPSPTMSDTGMYSCIITTQFTVMDTSVLGHPNWPDTATQSFDFQIAHVSYNPIDMNPVIIQQGDTLFSNASTGNQWHNALGPILGATDSFYVPTQAGSYYVVLQEGSCMSNNSNIINYTRLENIFSSDDIKIYPNPTSDILNIETSFNDYQVEILDILGRVLIQKNTSNNYLKIDLKPLTTGIYLVKIQNENRILVEQLRVE